MMLFSGRLHQVPTILLSFTIYIYSNPPCQLSLWKETREHGENQQLSAVLTNSFHVPQNTFGTKTGLTIYVQQYPSKRQKPPFSNLN